MPKVVLIGDSIRMGYEPVVRRELAAEAEIWAPAENGGTSGNVREHLHTWIVVQQPDLVHVNCGLHDIKTAFGASAKAIGIGAYRANVARIVETAMEMGAQVIWATTTPVNHAWHHANKDFDRFEADVRAYNEVAIEVAQSLGASINDLYSLVMAAGRDGLLLPDGVHFRPIGYELLGKTAAQAIRTALHQSR
ncbi:MAG: SGNH/GDSL hydrolase family protein [Anaerolineae bacterium]|nr:SGNH/GDSL hydrolase family protein [Anaerolineae bacterium]